MKNLNFRMKISLILALISFLLVGYYFSLPGEKINNLLVGLGCNLMVLSIGILIVNQYLENSARKEAVRSILFLSGHDMAISLDEWLRVCFTEFGGNRYKEIINEYERHGYNPEILSGEVRQKIYSLVTSGNGNQDVLKIFRKLDDALVELSQLMNWSLDSYLLAECLKARSSIRWLLSTKLDGSDESINTVLKHVFDAYLSADLAINRLVELADLAKTTHTRNSGASIKAQQGHMQSSFKSYHSRKQKSN